MRDKKRKQRRRREQLEAPGKSNLWLQEKEINVNPKCWVPSKVIQRLNEPRSMKWAHFCVCEKNMKRNRSGKQIASQLLPDSQAFLGTGRTICATWTTNYVSKTSRPSIVVMKFQEGESGISVAMRQLSLTSKLEPSAERVGDRESRQVVWNRLFN